MTLEITFFCSSPTLYTASVSIDYFSVENDCSFGSNRYHFAYLVHTAAEREPNG